MSRYEPRPMGRMWGIWDNTERGFDRRYLCINPMEAQVVANLKNKENAAHAQPEQPDWDDLKGCAPDATGSLSSEDFVRAQRDAWDDAQPEPARREDEA